MEISIAAESVTVQLDILMRATQPRTGTAMTRTLCHTT